MAVAGEAIKKLKQRVQMQGGFRSRHLQDSIFAFDESLDISNNVEIIKANEVFFPVRILRPNKIWKRITPETKSCMVLPIYKTVVKKRLISRIV